eukprot:scaffold207_cov409-Prasinococcus_capsulatus_cf.AAC.61
MRVSHTRSLDPDARWTRSRSSTVASTCIDAARSCPSQHIPGSDTLPSLPSSAQGELPDDPTRSALR